MNDYIREQLEQVFIVHEKHHELECWTEKGYNIILSVEDWDIGEVIQAIENFDYSDEVYKWWPDETFKANYDYDMSNAIADMKAWKQEALGIFGG